MKPTIEFKNVSVIYDFKTGIRALDIKELVIEHGENVAIIGPNGSGKSTLINIIAKALYPEPEENTICRIYGKDRWDIFELRSHLGLVTPGFQQMVGLETTVMDTVLSGFFSSIGILNKNEVTSAMKKKAEESLDFFGISGLSNHLMTEVSTGESRLVLIARALIHNPKALLLDEPASGLDIRAAYSFRKQLNILAEHGTGIIVVTHNFEDIIPAINRVVVLNKGKIFLDGKCDKILTNTNISKLYSLKVKIVKSRGRYRAELAEK
jgi:iron complex transport system ATP-binding protein